MNAHVHLARFQLLSAFLLILAGCTLAPVRSDAHVCSESLATLDLVRLEAEGMSIALPLGSTLESYNLEDAEYWTWKLPTGQVRVTGVGSIAREMQIERMSSQACRVHSKAATFTAELRGATLIAVSDPLFQNGSGLIVRLEMDGDSSSFATGLAMIRSLVVAPGD